MGARLLLARLGVCTAPMHASKAQLEKLYAERSQGWDREKDYRGHMLVAGALRALATRPGLDILDAGCGTGLVGPLVRDLAARLDGVDFSAAMLERAREKRAYDNLYQNEIVSFMAAGANGYDAITSAATLIHFGDLAPVFEAAAGALKDDGLFVFTLFPNDGETAADFAPAPDPELARGGCYAHAPHYVARLAEAGRFAVEMLARETHEHDPTGAPVEGLVVALRRRSRATGSVLRR
jgi:predicted TPR repeat methyltransferase